jgi:hypothetical protein
LEGGQDTDGNPEDMELLTDGSGIIDDQGISWRAEKGRFLITDRPALVKWNAHAFDYKIEGSTLSLSYDNGTTLTYIKLNKGPASINAFNGTWVLNSDDAEEELVIKNGNCDVFSDGLKLKQTFILTDNKVKFKTIQLFGDYYSNLESKWYSKDELIPSPSFPENVIESIFRDREWEYSVSKDKLVFNSEKQ